MKFPLSVCEERDPKGLYKLARAGKIECKFEASSFSFFLSFYLSKSDFFFQMSSFSTCGHQFLAFDHLAGFTGINDPYEAPLNCEVSSNASSIYDQLNKFLVNR
jgi:hypothetical protein